jgi:hypothetical protein
MSGATFTELDSLSTEELRREAFQRARDRRDAGFFWDLFKHLPHADDAEQADGSTGSIGSTIEDAIALWREFTGHSYGEQEGVIRAKFIDYLLANPA